MRERFVFLSRFFDSVGDPFPWIVGGLLTTKLLFARYLVFGHALGWGALADTLAVLAIVGLSASSGGSSGRRAVSVLSVVLSLIALASVVYAAYFEQLPSLRLIGSVQQVGELKDSIVDLLSWSHLLLVIDLPVVLWKAFTTPLSHASRRFPPALIGSNALVAFIAFAVAAGATGAQGDSLEASYRHGIVAFELSTLVVKDGTPSKDSNIAIAAAQTPKKANSLQIQIDALTGHKNGKRYAAAPEPASMSGKNLIVIQAEALQAGLVGARLDGQPIVPNLEKLIDESLYFPNTYSQIGRGNTADAEFIMNTSLYPPSAEPASVAYARKQIPSLPRLLSKKGYRTFTFHTNDAKFWNRFQLYPALGFDRYYDRSYFGEKDVTGYGASDQVLFMKTWEALLSANEEGTPFYAQIITVSAHNPFTAVDQRGKLDIRPEMAGTATARYLQSQNYFDQELGYFIECLRASGLMENSVIVVYGDHFGMRFKKATELDAQLRRMIVNHNYNQADYFNIPLVIHLPGGDTAPSRQSQVVGQVDIMPTIADLFGIDLSDTPHFGKSVFYQSQTLLAKGSFSRFYADEDLLYVGGLSAKDDRVYDAQSQRKVSAEGGRPERFGNAAKLLRLSEAYARSLPERASATDEIGIIPNSSRNKAAVK